ncbi:MAG: hypothetical protein ABIR47_16910, partial [Candidatus Kapaibacterium sp.]
MKSNIIKVILFVSLCSLTTGCAGLRFWDKGKFYQCELKDNIQTENIRTVGIYVYSNGEAVDGKEPARDAADVIGDVIMFPIKLLALGQIDAGSGTQVGMSKHFFPTKITKSLVLEPDTTNAGPSLELANAVKEEIASRGYNAKVVTDLGHSGKISVDQCLKHAKANGYDAIFVVNYTGLNRWTKYAGTDMVYGYKTRTEITRVNVFDGYLYIPNSALLDATTGETLWSNSYYGLVEKAHLASPGSESFNQAVSNALVDNGDDTYFKS